MFCAYVKSYKTKIFNLKNLFNFSGFSARKEKDYGKYDYQQERSFMD